MYVISIIMKCLMKFKLGSGDIQLNLSYFKLNKKLQPSHRYSNWQVSEGLIFQARVKKSLEHVN